MNNDREQASAAKLGLVRALSAVMSAVLVMLSGYFALNARYRVDPMSTELRPWPVYLDLPRRVEQERPSAAPKAKHADPATTPNGPESANLDPPQAPLEITDPVWLRRPRNPEGRYPSPAFLAGIEGLVDLDCLVDTSGRLECVVISETPEGWSFGDAALALARECLMQPPLRNGTPALGRYRMRVPFTQPRPQ